MRKFFILPLLMALCLFGMAIMYGGASLILYFDLPCLIICTVIPFIVLVSHYSLAEMGSAYSGALKSSNKTVEEIKRGIAFFRSAERQSLLAGGIGTFYGIIAMLANLADMSLIGRGLAAALITIFYSLLINQLVLSPFRNALEKKLVSKE